MIGSKGSRQQEMVDLDHTILDKHVSSVKITNPVRVVLDASVPRILQVDDLDCHGVV